MKIKFNQNNLKRSGDYSNARMSGNPPGYLPNRMELSAMSGLSLASTVHFK